MPKFLDVTDKALARGYLGTSTAYSLVSVKDHGATGDGETDDTDAIEAAFEAGSGDIYFPPGAYVYNGTGLADAYTCIVGAGFTATRIILGSDSYLFNTSTQIGSLNIRGIKTTGGKGIVKYTYTGSNVIRKYAIIDCEFNDYTECAIASDASDMPYWLIKNCYFNGYDTVNTIGVALGGGLDQCVIDSCSFVKNRVHFRAKGGANLQITNCDFIQTSSVNTNGPRVAVWIVPNATTNAGQGLVIRNSKFGNENLLASDYRILYADADAGATNGVKMPVLDADSTGYVYGHLVTGCFFGAVSPVGPSMVYSTTPNVRGISITDCYDDGSAYFLEFRTPQTIPESQSVYNRFGPVVGPGLSSTASILRISNAIGVAQVEDPAEVIQDSTIIRGAVGGAGYTDLLATEADDFTVDSGSLASQTDALGGSNAAKYTFTNSSGAARKALSAFSPGVPVFIEFDVKNPDDGNAMTLLSIQIIDNSPAHYHWTRRVEVPSVAQGWVTYRFHFTPRTAGSSHRLWIKDYNGGSGKTVIIGRPRVYHGTGWQVGGFRPTPAAAATTVMGSADIANDLRNNLISLGVMSGTPSTGSVTALGQVSSIELGHASDTTLSRTAAGMIAVEGNPLGVKVAVPASAGAAGSVGQWATDGSYIYVCTAASTWLRAPIATW